MRNLPADHDDQCRCSECGEAAQELAIHSKCHVDSPTWAWYDSENDLLHIKCAECERPIATFRLNPKGLDEDRAVLHGVLLACEPDESGTEEDPFSKEPFEPGAKWVRPITEAEYKALCRLARMEPESE
jgi:hypothetical protein